MKEHRHILLRINAARIYGRGLLSGIGRYAALHPDWQFFCQIPPYVKKISRKDELERIRAWHPHGVIVWDSEGLQDLLELEIPVICSRNLIQSKKLKGRIATMPHIETDCQAIGQLAADYFLQRGFHHFAYCGFHGQSWSVNRQQAFVERIEQAGYDVDRFERLTVDGLQAWQEEIQQIGQWIKKLPKPLALMACNDDRAFDVLEACKQAGCYVPEEVAVLGVDNEEQACKVSNPSLSSILLNTVNAGFEAATLLDEMIDGKAVEADRQWIKVRPLYVVTRQSTDTMAIEDPVVAEAVNFLQSNIFQKIQVDDVVRKLVISRRSLELRFHKALGRTIHEELRRLSVNRMIEMLLESSMSIAEVANTFGYADAHNLSRFFKKETGLSPLEYRKKYGTHQNLKA